MFLSQIAWSELTKGTWCFMPTQPAQYINYQTWAERKTGITK